MSDPVLSASGTPLLPTVAAVVLLCALDSAAADMTAGQAAARSSRYAPISSARQDAVRLQGYRRHYEEALASGQFLEAEVAAKQAIGHLIESDFGGHTLMANALVNLAFAQRQRQLYEAALQNYNAAIELLRASENRLSASLVAPLRALGDTYMASGRTDLALPAYEQALHIQHVNEGPHSLNQVEILDAMATALMESGDTGAALDATDRMYYLYAREFAPDGEEVLPALERKASLLNDAGQHQQERMVYREIVRIIRNRRGESDLSLLGPYSAMGRTYFHDFDDVYFRSEPTTETAETFLRKALVLTEENPDATWRMQEQALLELADYYTVRDVQDQARIHYRRAWQLLSSDEGRFERRQRDLGRVMPLVRPTLDRHANFGYRSKSADAEPSDYKDGYVVARFTINDRGRVTDVGIADAEPAGFAAMEVRVTRAVRHFVYRPRYENGRPVYTPGQLFRHDYLYLDSDLRADRE